MLETKAKEIDGVMYEVTQLDALKGRRVFVRFAKIVAPVLTTLKTAKGDEEQLLAGVLAQLFTSVSEDDVDFFCDAFAPSTRLLKDGKKPRLSDAFAFHFAGNYAALLQWLAFCVEVNFGSFFPSQPGKSDS